MSGAGCAAWAGAALCAVFSVVGLLFLEPLPPWIGPLQLLPAGALGVGLVLHSTAGREWNALQIPPQSILHPVLVMVGWALIAVCLTGMGKLAPAGAGEALLLARRLDEHCHGPPEVRIERRLLPELERLEQLLPHQPTWIRQRVEAALRAHLPRCAEQTRQAYADPEGVHRSWRLLRDWLAAHPQWVELPRELLQAAPRPRAYRPASPVVDVAL